MPIVHCAGLLIAGLVVAACTAGGGTPSQTAASPSASGQASRIEVKLSDALTIEPAHFTVKAGAPMTFVVTNSGSTEHEFYLGDEQAQQEHAKAMAAMGGMVHDEPQGIGVKPGVTKELTFTFLKPGQNLAGCHVAGHYGLGMKATVTVTE